MSMNIKSDTFTTFDDLWEKSNLTQAEKDEIQQDYTEWQRGLYSDLSVNDLFDNAEALAQNN